MINICKVKTGRKYWSNVGFEQKKINSVWLKFHLDEAQLRLLTSKIKTQVLPFMTDGSRDEASVTHSCSRAAYVQGPSPPSIALSQSALLPVGRLQISFRSGNLEPPKWPPPKKKKSCDGRLHLQGLA